MTRFRFDEGGGDSSEKLCDPHEADVSDNGSSRTTKRLVFSHAFSCMLSIVLSSEEVSRRTIFFVPSFSSMIGGDGNGCAVMNDSSRGWS